MAVKKVEIPVANDVTINMEFLDEPTEEVKTETLPEPVLETVVSVEPNCSDCNFGPPERRAFEACDIAMRRGNARHCAQYVRKL